MAEAVSKREQLRTERRRQIVKAALAVFAEKGFNAANVSDVAARAGVSQGTIYWYFESKEDLLTQALRTFFDDFGQGTTSALAQCPTATDKLRALGRAMVDFAEEAEGLFTLFLEYWASSPRRAEAGRLWTGVLVEYKDLVVGIVEQGVASGEFKPVDADSLVWAMMAAYDGLAAYVMFMPDLDLARISQAFVETLLKGLQVRSDTSS
ncbi:MAG: TetR/AcrR family transcriptional regulator [Anaerolineae bacterium]|nr:TetR/AcrR family transcriptional regulator [Anaerolineae bacterium]